MNSTSAQLGRMFNDHISFTVPLGPSVNNAYPTIFKSSPGGDRLTARRIASKELQVFKYHVWAILSELHLRDVWAECEAVGYTTAIYVRRSNADLSNYLKAYEDAVCSSLGFDDRLIVSICAEKFVDAAIPRIEGTWYRYA